MLNVNFKIDDKVTATLQKASRESAICAVLIFIENETMKQLGDPIPSSSNLASDLEKIRSALRAAQLKTAYVVVYSTILTDPVTIVVYASDSAKAKERMPYSTGSTHLREFVSKNSAPRRSGVQMVQASTIDGIQPGIFKRKEDAAGRESLMTESERHKAAIEKMPLAPQPTAMPGVEAPLSNEANILVQQFAKASATSSGGMVITFKIEDSKIIVDKHKPTGAVTNKNEQLASAQSMLPANEPRYVLTDYCQQPGGVRKTVMAYVCPSACPPKVKMPYASCKASFLNQLSRNGLSQVRRVETGSVSELVAAITEAFTEVDHDQLQRRTQLSKPPGARGPRMLI